MAPSAFVTLCLLALASAASQTNPENVAKIDALLPEVCTLSQGQSDMKVASLVAQAIDLLKFTPDDAVVGVLDKIRAGQYCEDYTKLESMFLDAVAFVGTPGAFKVMEQEIEGDRTTGGRLILYTVAMTPLRPILEEYKLIAINQGTELIQVIQAVIKDNNVNVDTLVEELKKITVLVKNTIKEKNINTDTVVLELNKLIQLINDTIKDKDIHIESIVAEIKKITKVIQDTLKSKGINTDIIIVKLKALIQQALNTIKEKDINIDNIAVELKKFLQLVQVTLKSKGIDIDIIIVKLKALVQLTLNTIKEKDININSIAVELQKILQLVKDSINNKDISINAIVNELNRLTQLVIKTIKEKNINVDNIVVELKKFLQVVQVALKNNGIDIDTLVGELNLLLKPVMEIINNRNIYINTIIEELNNLIQLVLNTIKDKDINIDTIVKEFNKLTQLVLNTIKENNITIDTIVVELKKILQLVQVTLKDNGINTDTLVGELNLILKPVMEMIKNKNIYIDTIIVELTKLVQPVVDIMVKTVIPVISEALIGAKNFNMDTKRAGQINIDFLIPTGQGYPLKVKLTGTAVVGMKMINNLNVNKGSIDSLLKIIPSLNAHVEAELGFGEQLSTGLKLKHDAYTTNGFALSLTQKNGEDIVLQYELPEKMELFSIQNEVILMKNDKAINEVQLFPGEIQDVRIVDNQCVGIVEPITGLMLCYEINTPNPVNSNSLQLGKPMLLRVYLQRSDATMNGYTLAAKFRNKPDKKFLKIDVGSYGSANSKKSTMKLGYTAEADTHLMTFNIQSSLIKSTSEITFTNQPELKSLQIYSNDKVGTFAPVVGSAKVEFKPVTVSNGKTYEVVAFAGLTKSLDEKHRLSQMMLSILENGDLISAKLVTKTDLFPVMFEVEVDLPKNAGVRVYKVQKITARSSVSSIVVESSIFKKSPEEFQTTLLVLNSGSSLINIDAVHTVSIASTLIGGTSNKVNLMTSVNGKLPTVEFGFDSNMSYEKGVVALGSVVRHFDSEVVALSSKLAYSTGALETSGSIKYYNAEALALKSKLAYNNGAFKTSSSLKYFNSEALVLKTKLAFTNGAIEALSSIKYADSETLALKSKLAYTNRAIDTLSSIKYYNSEVLALKTNLAYINGAIEALNSIKYYDSEALELKTKFAYINGAVEASSSIKYYNAEALALQTKLAYANGAFEALISTKYFNSEALALKAKLSYTKSALEASSDIKYFDSELVHLNSKLSWGKTMVEFTSEATYLDATVFTAALQQTFDITNLVFMAEFMAPMAELNVQKKMSLSKMVFESTNLVLYSGSEVVNMITKLSYTDGSLDISSKATSQYFGTTLYHVHVKQTVETLPLNFAAEVEITTVFKMNLQQTVDSAALTTLAQVEIPTVIKPIKINHVFGINSAFSYSVLTDVKTGDLVLLHIEGPMSFEFSRKLVKQNLDLKISGAFDGTFKIMHSITMSLKKIQYTLDMRHTNTQIVFVEFALDRSNAKEIAVKSSVNVPFVIESAMDVTLSTSLIHTTINVLAVPSTQYVRRFKGYSDFNWVENNFKGELYWDAEKNNDMKIGFTTKYALDTTAFKLVIQGDLIVTTLSYGYKLESSLASPFEWFQGVSGTEFIVTMPNQKTAVVKSLLEIQYAESHVEFKPMFAFITINENKYELTTSVVLKKLPVLLNFAIESASTLSTPQLQKVTFTTSLKHEEKNPSGIIIFKMTLEESVLSEAISFEYLVKADPSDLSSIVKVMKGSKSAALSTIVHLAQGLNAFEITNELSLPFNILKSVTTKVTKTAEGTTTIALMKNQETLLSIYYSMPSFTSHIVGITFPSRTMEFSAVFAKNQVTFKVFPEKNKSAKVVEATLRLIKKAGAGQFEVLVSAPSLPKEMRFAVELELVEPGKDGLDMVSMDVQYQVAGAPKLLKATVNELKNVYLDLVNDGMCPDLNKWYREVQKVAKKLPKVLNSVRDELEKSLPVYYEFVKNYALDLYNLYEADIIAMWETARTELLRYFNIVKTEAPVFFNKYVAILKNTETWNAVNTLLNEILVNYPVYYDAAVDFYNKVVSPYVVEVVEMIGEFLVLPEFDVSQYVTLLKKEVPTIVKNVATQVMDTKVVKMMQEKVNELKSLYPTEFSFLEDVYTNVIIPTSTEVLTMVNKMVAVTAFDYQKYLNVIITDMPEIFNKFSQRILGTQIVNKIRAAYPTLFINIEDIFSNVIVPTMNEIVSFVKKVATLPVDFEEYLALAKVEVPVFVIRFMQRVLDTQLVKNLKNVFPTVFAMSEDLYTKVLIPTLVDLSVLAEKLIAFPVVDFQETLTQYWAFIKAEVPPMFNKFAQRLPETKLVQKIRTVFPMVFEVAGDFYSIIIAPTAGDFATVVEKMLDIPLSDTLEGGQQYLNILKVEMPTLMAKFFGRLPETQIVKLIKENSTLLIELLQEKLTELKAQNPEAVAFILDFYNQFAVPAYSELAVVYGKLTKTTDVYEVRDILAAETLVFMKHLQLKLVNISEVKTFMKIVISKFSELINSYPNEYQTVLRFYNQISQITLSDILASLKSYINDELHITFSISAEKFTFVFPLPVSVETVRNYYHIITVYVPSYVADVVAKWIAEGRVFYSQIEAKIPVIVEYINTQAPIYLQYINNHLETLKKTILPYVENIQTILPKYLEEVKQVVLPYVQELASTAITYFELAKNSAYTEMFGKKVKEVVELLIIKFNEVITLYPNEYQAIMDFLTLYLNICMDYATWAITTFLAYPPVEKAIEYINNLTTEKVQASLVIVMEFVMSAMNQLEAKVNHLIVALPKEIPAFFEMHLPVFIMSFIKTIMSYLH